MGDAAKEPVDESKHEYKTGVIPGTCISCQLPMGKFLGTITPEGPLHNDCVPNYKRMHLERCAHCDNVLAAGKRAIVGGVRIHPECSADYKAKKPYVKPSKSGILQKFAVGKSMFGSKNWKQRFFVLNPNIGFAYYESTDAYQQALPPKGKITINPQTTRLVQHPQRSIHREAMNPSKEFIIIFFEGGKEYKLLVAASTWEEHDEWTRALECYIKVVDEPTDYPEK